jgi:hypothetical protein
MSANNRQVGGSHYQQGEVPQHWDVVIALNWDYLLGAATKYLWRLGRKGDTDKAIEDIGKAIHYLEKKQELMVAQRAGALARGSAYDPINGPSDPAAGPGRGYVAQ